MNQMSPVNVSVNGRNYAWPRVTAIAICLDGCEPAYLDEAIKAGLMPALVKIKEKGTVRMAHSVIPSFTNPNNMSIATGRPPSVHGICGNYLYERETGKEVMMNDPRFLRAPTIFKAYYDAGARVAVVTAKDKLRALLGHGLAFDEDRAICFSSEKSDKSTKAEHGIDNEYRWFRCSPAHRIADDANAVRDFGARACASALFLRRVAALKPHRPKPVHSLPVAY